MFFWPNQGCNYSVFTIRKHFCHQAPIARFIKTCFPAFPEFCKDIPMKRCTIPWEKMSGDSVLWVLTAIPVVTLIRWNFTVRWLPSKKLEACFLFQKTQNCEQSSCNEKNEEVCFSCKFKAATMQLILGEILLLPKVPNSQVYKIMLSCSFRTV